MASSRVRVIHLPCSCTVIDTTIAGNLAFLYEHDRFPTLDLDALDSATVLLSRREDHAYTLVLHWRGEALSRDERPLVLAWRTTVSGILLRIG
jgi:hypothetical protein